MRAVFGPVGAIGDDRAAADDRLHVGGQRHQRIDRRIDAGRRAHARQRLQFRADQEGIDAAGVRRQRRRNAGSCCGSSRRPAPPLKKAFDLRRRRRGAVGRARLPRRRIAGDAAAPGIGRLRRRAGPGIGQRIAGRDIHHQERIERDLQARAPSAPRSGRARCRSDGVPPKAGAAVDRRHQMARSRGRRRPPTRCRRWSDFSRLSIARPHAALPAAQIGAEPGHHHGDAFEIRRQRLQFVERGDHVGRRHK